MNKINIIGIGFRPLDKKASEILLASDVVLTNKGLRKAFESYAEYESVKKKIFVHASVHEMLDYISANYDTKKISVLAVGDPMFFGVGRLVIERFGKDHVEVYPDLSSVQVAFSRVKRDSEQRVPCQHARRAGSRKQEKARIRDARYPRPPSTTW